MDSNILFVFLNFFDKTSMSAQQTILVKMGQPVQIQSEDSSVPAQVDLMGNIVIKVTKNLLS